MKYALALLLFALTNICLTMPFAHAKIDNDDTPQEAANKQLALNFFHDLWGSNKTDRYVDYVAETYVVHDIGDRKGVVEPAIEQKRIADRFWAGGEMTFELDYQIAQGDLVATRWIAHYQADSLMAKLMFGSGSIPIINVLRIEDGRIVEFWNHRHDIDSGMTNLYVARGLLIGLLIALIPTLMALRLGRKLKRIGSTERQ